MVPINRLVEILTGSCPVYDETRICVFTPVLVMTLGVIGLGAVTGYLDAVLFPGLAVFPTLALYRLST
ncbi:MAG: mercury resistance system transport protein MerF [Nitrospiraceae bacterium]